MSEEQSPRLTDSPCKRTHLHVTRKLSRSGDDSVDADEYAREYYNFQDRRGSSQSISRYNSCPQLAEGDSEHTESYERTVDDINTNTSALNRDMHCVIVQGPSPPLFIRKGLRENGQVSDTPAPPSTPKSRRSVVSSHNSILSSPDKICVTSPIASPRLLLRKQLIQSALSRDSSFDSLKDQSPVHHQKKIPLSVENLSKFDEIKTGDEPINTIVGQTVRIGSVRSRKMSQTIEAAESLSKCENWLQTLNIAQTDKIKSKSHI
ncbi:hypothetical protein DPMN_067938 [Dreissena polymorpha]|uniref:Uncharacterized protein n=1 Tax=Dreissena polymorpha TaxID=45954 RepID=A0A9D3Z0M3_DREPO|nr:hypothetical protein DPMN_067938 [Dreissena polymorpha]